MNNSKIIEQIDCTPWLKQTKMFVAKGRPGSHVDIASQSNMTLAKFLRQQTQTMREGRLTQAEYTSADRDKQKADKGFAGGEWISLASYEHDYRNRENWQGSNAVVIDADAKHGINEGARYAFSSAQLKDRLAGLQFLALPTHSYLDEIPRWRIIVTLSEIVTDPTEYAAIAHALAKRLDDNIDPRTFTPEQYWYSMSAPKDERDKRLGMIVVGG